LRFKSNSLFSCQDCHKKQLWSNISTR
jgi:hypothetical protein